MNFIKSNYKTALLIALSIILQIGVVIMIFNPSGKDKKLIDSTLASENMEAMADGTEVDPIDESKINAVSGHRTNNETHEDSEDGMEEIIEYETEGIGVGRTNVQVGYQHKEPTQAEISKATGKVSGTNKKPEETMDNKTSTGSTGKKPRKKPSSKPSSKPAKKPSNKPSGKPSKKPSNDKPTTPSKDTDDKKDTVADAKKKIVGKWKSDSDDNSTDMYWEFFDDGTYGNYDEQENMVYSGSYTFSSSNRIKISIKEDKETFTSDIDFKDENSFTVDNTEYFNFKNYKKV